MPAPVLQFKRGNAGVAGTVPALRPGEPAISLNNFDFFIGIDTSVANNKFFGSHRYWGREDGTTALRLKLVDKSGTNSINLKAPDTLSGIATYTLPSTPVAGNFLKVDANGILSWDAVTSSATFNNSILSGITTITGGLNNQANTNNSGITTFTNTTDNTLGNSNTGAVQIDGGLGVDKNVTVGGNLNVQGQSEFVGVVTFRGGIINIGDGTGDNINIGGRFSSNLVPSQDNSYDVGISTLNWRNAHFSGIGTFETGAVIDGIQIGINGANVIDTVSGDLRFNSASGSTIIDDAVTIQNNLVVNGNVTVGGTTVTLRGQDVFIENKDIILGYTTSITPNDDTANHAGVAIASTIGTPLANFDASGINTLPSTYKQMMWFKSGTLGFATDAFAFNYGVAIGTINMANGVRLAVGSGITMSDNAITVTDLNTNSSVVSLFNANAITVNAFQSATNLVLGSNTGITTFQNSVRISDSLYDSDNNAGTFGQFLTATNTGIGWTTISGIASGTISTAARSNTVDTTGTSDNNTYYVVFADTSGGQTGETLRVGTALSLNASSGNVKSSGDLLAGSGYLSSGNGTRAMYMYDASGDVSFQGKVVANNFRSSSNANNTLTFNDLDASFARNINIIGVTTTVQLTIGTGVAVTQFSSSVSAGSSTSSVPTSKAVIDYIGSQVGNIDLTLGINADTGGPSTVNTSQTLTIAGTPNEVETSVSGQTITVGLPDAVIVGTSLSAPTIRTNTIQSQNTGSTVLTLIGNDATFADDLTVNGNLYVQGSTTQVNTTTLAVEDRTIELGRLDTNLTQPTTTTWDLAVLFNYGDGIAKKAGLVWEASGATKRFQFTTDVNPGSDGSESQTNLPSFTVSNFAPIEISELWVTDCSGTSQVISCTGTERYLENITIDAGQF